MTTITGIVKTLYSNDFSKSKCINSIKDLVNPQPGQCILNKKLKIQGTVISTIPCIFKKIDNKK